MNLEEIKQFITDNGSDPEVMKYLDSIADKRVTSALETARNKFESEVPGRIEKALQERDALKQQREDKKSKLAALLSENKIDVSIGLEMVGDVDNISDDEMGSKVSEVTERYESWRQKLLVEKYGGDPPKISSGESILPDMKTASSQQILDNLEHYNQRK